MRSNFLQLNTPCQENWDNMTPNDNGSFCASCSKNVIDLTQLNELEISEIINQSGKGICARLTKTQLNAPLLDPGSSFEVNIPTSKIAAGLALATSLTIGNTAHAETPNLPTEVVQSSDPAASLIKEATISRPSEQTSDSITVFKGKVTCADLELPLENAKITFVTAQKLFSTYTGKDGTFSIEIPNEFIDDDNVVRLSYNNAETEKEERDTFHGYETKDYILSKKELTSSPSFEAEPELLYLGEMAVRSSKLKPIVLSNGVEINYRAFNKARRGEESSCSLENKSYLHFYGDYAIAIYGRKAKDGLYILTEE